MLSLVVDQRTMDRRCGVKKDCLWKTVNLALTWEALLMFLRKVTQDWVYYSTSLTLAARR